MCNLRGHRQNVLNYDVFSVHEDHFFIVAISADTDEMFAGPRSAVGNVSGYRYVSSIPARSHTFVEIDHEIISRVILLPSAESFMKGCCQLQAKVCARITGYPLVQACPGKKCG